MMTYTDPVQEPHKMILHPSPEAQRKWRSAVALVRNPRRRFRHVADLVKRSEAQKKRKSIQENDIDSKLLPNNFSSFDALLAFSFLFLQ
ncbi:hypothetical protein F8388_004872 [Cannabis sativa]|uniref:Calcium-transporting P-type ATPase N-terminal autoinhibitory domain-containing protein n=1 Tax=Cannabis sativa TaxID=3483 RepID=A0A7J6HNR3_CANSA|nr:hypothetical protein F8388_004872 [Cannabis sativa]